MLVVEVRLIAKLPKVIGEAEAVTTSEIDVLLSTGLVSSVEL